MATINLGAIKFNWKGAYNSGTSYAVDDVVSSGGNSYVCIQAHSNQAVGNATAYWNIMSAKGTNGTDADLLNIASTAQGDIYYNNGSAIARLGAGTSGQFLKTLGTGANPAWGTVTTAVLGVKTKQSGSIVNVQNTGSPDYVFGDICGGNITYTPQSTNSKIICTLNAGLGSVSHSTDIGHALAFTIAQSGGINQTNSFKTPHGDYSGGGNRPDYGNDIMTMRVYDNSSTNQITLTGQGYVYSEGTNKTIGFRYATLTLMEVAV